MSSVNDNTAATLAEARISEPLELPDRVYAQYADKPKARKWLELTRSAAAELAAGIQSVRECLDIDKATGQSLEMIGRIVVVDRIRQEVLLNPGIFSDPDGTNYGNESRGFSSWSTYTDQSLSDEMLRLAIRAKIIKNTANPTADELLQAFRFLFPNGNVFRLFNHHDMSFTVEYIGVLSPLEQWLIQLEDFIPNPQGVRLRGFIRSYGIIEFLSDDEASFGNEALEFIA